MGVDPQQAGSDVVFRLGVGGYLPAFRVAMQPSNRQIPWDAHSSRPATRYRPPPVHGLR